MSHGLACSLHRRIPSIDYVYFQHAQIRATDAYLFGKLADEKAELEHWRLQEVLSTMVGGGV